MKALYAFLMIYRILAALMGVLLWVPSALAFSDVSSDHVFYEAIDYVEEEGIVGGYEDGTYLPEATINRAEFTKIIVEATMEVDTADLSLDGLDFTDLSDGAWYNPYVRAAVDAGLVQGYEDGTFQPGENINFVEAAKIIAVGFDLDLGSGSPWYEPYVEALEDEAAIPMGVLGFSSELTRGEMAEMVYRLHAEVDDKVTATYDLLSLEPQYWPYEEDLYEAVLGQRAFTLYFHADWCATCVAIEEYLSEHMDTFPEGTLFLEVDYDEEIELRQTYGIVSQFTFVILNAEEEEIATLVTNNIAYVRAAIQESLK